MALKVLSPKPDEKMGLKSIAFRIAAFGAAVAVAVGIAGRVRPSLFMSLPFPLSIILWASTGNPMPPYFSPDAWAEDEVKTWTRPGDLIVSGGVKMGTTWMLYCTHQIRLRGSDDADDLFREVGLTTPFVDLIQSRGGSWAEQKDRLNTTTLPDGTPLRDLWDSPRYPFRIFKSHYTPAESGGALPIRTSPQLKFLAIARNGLDVVSSMVRFFRDHTDDFRGLWGGFPPDARGTPEEDKEARLTELLPGGLLEDIYFGYIREWWTHRHDPNVLLLHYTDVRRDLTAAVRKISDFLGVNLTKKELEVVTKRCYIEHMKKNKHMFHYTLPLNTDPSWDNEHSYTMKQMVNTGYVGKGKDIFTKEQQDRWHSAEEEQLGSIDQHLLQWAREGGPFP